MKCKYKSVKRGAFKTAVLGTIVVIFELNADIVAS